MVGRRYPCCTHCEDDIVHDVPKDGHTVSCSICDGMPALAAAWEAGYRAGTSRLWTCGSKNPYVVADQTKTD